jgi:Flp pilus assembly protein TadB
MKEIFRFVGYAVATLAMIFLVIGIAKAGASPGVLASSAIIIVVVVPVIIGIFMAKREKRNASNQ